MSQVKCLTCKYVGAWSLPVGAGDALRSIADCMKPVDLDGIPVAWLVQRRPVQVYSDGSGWPHVCHAWEEKPCRDDGRCQQAIDQGCEDIGRCPKGECGMHKL